MNSKTKNIIIGLVVVGALFLIYFLFIKKSPVDTALTSSSGTLIDTSNSGSNKASEVGKDFITLLLSVKSINLDDVILKDNAFLSLRDSSITLVGSNDEGRINPFAPIGTESISQPVILPTDMTTPATGDVNTPPTINTSNGSKKN